MLAANAQAGSKVGRLSSLNNTRELANTAYALLTDTTLLDGRGTKAYAIADLFEGEKLSWEALLPQTSTSGAAPLIGMDAAGWASVGRCGWCVSVFAGFLHHT